MRPLPLTLVLSVFQTFANALRFPLQTRAPALTTPGSSSQINGGLSRRATVNSSVPLVNFENLSYFVNITLGGKPFVVLIDTGSSDLWVYGDVPNTSDTGKTAGISYAIGNVQGSILEAPLSFAGYNAPATPFIHVTNVSSFSVDPTTEGFDGLVGLGPNSGSAIYSALGDATGGTMMDSIFELNMTSGNYITFMLDREEDPTNSIIGQMTVSEPVTGFEAIETQTKLSVVGVEKIALVSLLGGGSPTQHWSAYTDANGVIGPDGNAVKVDSLTGNAPKQTLVAVFDSGFSLPQVSRSISDAIYGRAPGAVWDGTNGWWTVPCAQELNISFVFGGQKLPIHPLDTSMSDVGGQTAASVNGVSMCIGAFQPIGEGAIDRFGSYDLILGMSFLRNAYMLLDYGNFLSETSTDKDSPFIQLYSTTDPSQAHSDFVKARLNGIDTTGDPQYALLSKGKTSPVTLHERELFFKAKHLEAIYGGVIGGVVLIFGLVLWCCCFRRRKDGRRGLGFGKPKTMDGAKSGGGALSSLKTPFGHQQKYSSLDDPAPGETYELNASGFAPSSEPYHDPYRK
ncbi:hypothetical protein FRB95_007589 [Tulasnella sp. JGI-2019a]|nr:hypothetical protein FRB95_007589 [Tulasnella sp. JGI-2019a]